MPVECSPQNEPCGYRSFEVKCSCGCRFYMVVSTEVPGLFALSTDPQKALLTLLNEQALSRVKRQAEPPRGLEIPDFLPPEL